MMALLTFLRIGLLTVNPVFEGFQFFKILNIRNFPTLLNSYHKNTSGKSEGLIVMIVTKCEKFHIAQRRWCSRSKQGMENPDKLIIIFSSF